ncbi:PEP-CTERM sorting domain-containing protein [Aquincola sp. MAHUQ-54]|uniref:PEP-CTERM sorting domain-containing protein n=1 Tax=Aquincola agrisoli TaxID=3119538 RepID=A0AAW9QD40_9BURK
MTAGLRAKTMASLALCAASAAAWGAACDGSSDPCTLDLGRVVVHFDQGAASYFANAELISGDDASFQAVPDFFSSLALQHAGATEGFSFTPIVYGAVGGSGKNGYNQLRGYFDFTGLSFQAKPGYRLDALWFHVAGYGSAVGDASFALGLPVGVAFEGDNFAGSGPLNPDDGSVHAEFVISAAYLEGEDGTAISYGYATAAFTAAAFTATVSAVPEPGPWALLLAGLAGVGLRVRRPR